MSPPPAFGQDQAVVDALATVLAAEDSRMFNEEVFTAAARHPTAMVRRRAALALGRIGDGAGSAMLIDLLDDVVPSVRADAAFALGILRDESVLPTLRELVLGTAPEQQDVAHEEAIAAVARIGGSEASVIYDEMLVRWVGRALVGDALPAVVQRGLAEAWRLGDLAPAERLAQFAESSTRSALLPAVYSLGRLRAPEGANVLIRALSDDDAYTRAIAARALTAVFADTAGLDRRGTSRRIMSLVEDDDPHVRINALRTLGSFEDPGLTAAVANGLSDNNPNGRVAALAALGKVGGVEAARLLRGKLEGGSFAERREALLGLARASRDEALIRSAVWLLDEDWLSRLAGVDALGIIGGDTAAAWLADLARDTDPRIVGRAFSALTGVDSLGADELARELIVHDDPVVRSLAAGRIGSAPRALDFDLLVESYGRSTRDNGSDARLAIVSTLGTMLASGVVSDADIEERFLQRFPECDDYLVRREAIDTLPPAAAIWGPVEPIETGRNPEDYRDIARRLILPAEQDGLLPAVIIETELGEISVRLFAADAPITVDALLQLADRHYFDGGNWHRVVPNFVIQDGDPRGDGWGGPGFSLRDENSRLRYGRGTVGMALSGSDTGGSQFFITHSPQPHLEGTYAVVGQVDQGMDVVDRVTLGDRIRTIRRR